MSDQAPEQDDLRPEYDFSRGIRGKHAARLAADRDGSPPAWLLEAVRYDRQAWISEALRRSQELEGLLVAYLVLAFRLEPAVAETDVANLLEGPQSETLQRIGNDLDDGALSPTGALRQRLDRLFDERKWLVHRSLQQQAEEPEPAVAGKVTARLQRLSAETAAVTEQLRRLIIARFTRAGMTRIEFEQRSRAVLREWLAA